MSQCVPLASLELGNKLASVLPVLIFKVCTAKNQGKFLPFCVKAVSKISESHNPKKKKKTKLQCMS